MVDRYGEWGNVDRTLSTDLDLMLAQFPDLAGLIVFPHFTPEMILDVAEQGRTMPAGVTRFVIPGRILRLNAPLDKLASDEPLALKRSWLDTLVMEKLAYRQVRYYEEPVVLLDE
jgi:L-serine kinase (ATP) / ParB family transcriptional regulator, heme-responsive regulator